MPVQLAGLNSGAQYNCAPAKMGVVGSKNEINYTGKKLSLATGLVYFNQRWYDPEIGRFLTHDPAGQTLNPYMYCANNPLSNVDPDGLWSLGFKIFGWGLSLGDEGVSVSSPILTLGVDFSDGSFYGSAGIDLGSNILGNGYSLGMSYTHNFTNGGQDVVGANFGASVLGYSAGINYNSINGNISTYQPRAWTDFHFDTGIDLTPEDISPLEKELTSTDDLGTYDPQNPPNHPVAVAVPLFPFSDLLLGPIAVHTQIIENPSQSWSFGPYNQTSNRNNLMQNENIVKTYSGAKIIHHFTNTQKYYSNRSSGYRRFAGETYNLWNLKCHNPVRHMIDLTR